MVLDSVPIPILVVLDDGNEVLMAEKSRFKAMVEKDLVTLDQVIHEDLVYIHSNGSVDTKASYIAAIKDGSRAYNDITMEDAKVRTYGVVGIINAKCTYHRTTPEGRADNLTLYYTSVYAKIDGRWQQVSWQSFKVTE
jgi:ketosteroid isomerase-like protein